MDEYKTEQVFFRAYDSEKEAIKEYAKILGFRSVSAFVRECYLLGLPLVKAKAKKDLEERLKNM